MKKKYTVMLFTAAVCLSCAVGVQGEELDSYTLEPEKEYSICFGEDDTEETFSFQTSVLGNEEEESHAVLDLYLNGSAAGSFTDESWSYDWRVSQCPLEGDGTYLLASSVSYNDWTSQFLLLKKNGSEFKGLIDLNVLTRQVDNETGKVLSGWARVSDVAATDENTFTVNWYDTCKITGVTCIPVTYTLEDGQIIVSQEPCKLDETMDWTAWQSFTVFDEKTEGASPVFQVEPGEVVHLTEYVKENEKIYFKCVNQDGQEGWLPDADDYISESVDNEYGYACGYFEEAFYAG